MTGIRISFILPVLLIAATTANTAHAQFGGGDFGGDGRGSFPGQGFDGNERLVDSGQVMVTWSEHKDELRGFSQTKGEWTLLKIEPQKQVVPVMVGVGVVAAVKLSGGMAAYSGETGTWDVVKLPANSDAQPTVTANRVQFRDSDHLYTFAASTGRWTSPTDERLQRATETIRLPTMIRGNQVDALRQAFDKASVVVDRFMLSGSPEGPLLVVDTRKSDVERVREIVEQFVTDHAARDAPTIAAPSPADVRGSKPAEFPSFIQPVVDPAEQQALDLARTLRDAGKPTDEQQAELKELVLQSLEARFQQQANQVQQLTEKLEKVRSALEQRQQNKDRIIQRRVEELLDPSVNWASLTSRSAPVNVAATGTPIGLAGPAHIPMGSPAAVSPDLFGNATSADPLSVAGSASGGIRPRDELFTELTKQHRKATVSRSSILDNLRLIETDESDYNVEAARKEVDRWRDTLRGQLTEWKQVWRDYESGIRLLELDVEGARAMLMADENYAQRLRDAAGKHPVSSSQVRKVEDRVYVSQLQVQGTEERLRFYKSLAEDAPYLDPGTFDVSQVLEPDSGRNQGSATPTDDSRIPVSHTDNSDAATRVADSVTYERRNAVTSADVAPADRLPGIDPELIADMRSRLEGAHSEVERYAKSFSAGAKLVRLLEKPVAEWTADEKAGLQELARASFVRIEVPEGDDWTEEWRKKQFEFNMPVSVIHENELRLKENKTAWDRAWTDYQSRVRLLNLDVQEAELVLKQRREELGVAITANQKGGGRTFTRTEMSARELAAAHAQIAVQRATERLRQLTDIVAKQLELDPTKFTMPEGIEDAIQASGDF